MKLRIKFSKFGAMKFIGHLDVMRYFQKAIRRAEIDIEYSGGYSPHQIMAFAAPLGVGLTSDGEYFDIQVNSVTNREDMIERLDNQMSAGFKIIDIVMLDDNAPNAMASVQAASYFVSFREGRAPEFDLEDAVNRFNLADSLILTKQTKKSEIELDIKPSVYVLEAKNNGLYMMLNASSGGNIKPELVLRGLCSFYGTELVKNAMLINRVETYGINASGDFIPLIDFGRSF